MNGDLYREVEIEQTENGYIVKSGLNKKEVFVFTDLDDALTHVREFYE